MIKLYEVRFSEGVRIGNDYCTYWLPDTKKWKNIQPYLDDDYNPPCIRIKEKDGQDIFVPLSNVQLFREAVDAEKNTITAQPKPRAPRKPKEEA